MGGADQTQDIDPAPGLAGAVAEVLGPDGKPVGAGFLVAEDVLVTCAHVVQATGGGPGETVRLLFPHAEGAPQSRGWSCRRAGGTPRTKTWPWCA